MMTKEEKQKLKEKLPFAWCKILSERTKLSKGFVQKVMNGIRMSSLIEMEALKLAKENESQRKEIEELKSDVL